jgi:hypothetical protein
MTVSALNKFKIPIFKVNPALNDLLDIPMFEDKIAEANEVLRTVGLPEPLAYAKKGVKRTKNILTVRKRKKANS